MQSKQKQWRYICLNLLSIFYNLLCDAITKKVEKMNTLSDLFIDMLIFIDAVFDNVIAIIAH